MISLQLGVAFQPLSCRALCKLHVRQPVVQPTAVRWSVIYFPLGRTQSAPWAALSSDHALPLLPRSLGGSQPPSRQEAAGRRAGMLAELASAQGRGYRSVFCLCLGRDGCESGVWISLTPYTCVLDSIFNS